jgi:hypothetical protein
MVSMLSGSDDGLGGGLSCPEKDRFTNYNPEDSSEDLSLVCHFAF